MKEEARKAWHGPGASLRFEPGDFEALDLALGQIPELRICAMALKRMRDTKLKFPIVDAKGLSGLLEKGRFEGGGHEFSSKDVATFMPPQFFPINDEGELVSRMYVGILRCKQEENMKLHASPEVLKAQQVAEGGRDPR